MALILVTGGAGFIGSALIRALLAGSHKVRTFDSLITGSRENLAEVESRIEFLLGDLREPAALEAACRGVDVIFHEAALTSVPRSISDPVGNNEHNVTGTLNLLVAARAAGVKRVIFAGSSSVYGDREGLAKSEGMATAPISPYGVSKSACEQYMQSFYRVYGLETVVLRYFNVFGPRQSVNSQYSAVLAKFITQMLAGEQPTIYGDGEQSRDFTFVENVVHANLLAMEAPAAKVAGKVFNAATGVQYSLNETYRILQGLTGYQRPAGYAPPRPGDIKHSLADISRAKEVLGYAPAVDFATGLRLTVEWYRGQAVEPGRP